MSIEEMADLDLFEYDGFDSFEDNSYQSILNKDSAEGGIPLSVEILESMKKNCKPHEGGTSKCFVKASEIFLRIESNIKSGSEPLSIEANENNESASTNIEHIEKPNLPELNNENDVNLLSNWDDCVELLYDNEFLDPSKTELNYDLPTRKCNNNIENDNEELFLEGISK